MADMPLMEIRDLEITFGRGRRAVRCAEGVSLTVYSSGGFSPPETSACPSAFAEGGRGLFLVDTVAVERTVTEDGGIRVLIKL